MCLSTVYKEAKADENVCCKFVAKIEVKGDVLTFTDVLGEVTEVTGHLVSCDLAGGVVVFTAA